MGRQRRWRGHGDTGRAAERGPVRMETSTADAADQGGQTLGSRVRVFSRRGTHWTGDAVRKQQRDRLVTETGEPLPQGFGASAQGRSSSRSVRRKDRSASEEKKDPFLPPARVSLLRGELELCDP